MILAATRAQAAKTRRLIELPGLFSYYKAEWLQTEPAQGSRYFTIRSVNHGGPRRG